VSKTKVENSRQTKHSKQNTVIARAVAYNLFFSLECFFAIVISIKHVEVLCLPGKIHTPHSFSIMNTTYLAEHINQLALALVAPLRTEDDVNAVVGAGHGLSSGQLRLPPILLAGSRGARRRGRSGRDAHGFLDLGNAGGNVAQERHDRGFLGLAVGSILLGAR